jgi:hypothetical protein
MASLITVTIYLSIGFDEVDNIYLYPKDLINISIRNCY